jgi:zinc D-Ala-D-Ala carboxypeptidase
MRLSSHFTLSELTVTSTGLLNAPSAEAIVAMGGLCVEVLEPWRLEVGPIGITSGYRSRAVNKAVSGSDTSQHMLGEAVDGRPLRCELARAWGALVDLVQRRGLPVDQAIIYVRAPGRGWIHVSHTARRPPRRELLVQTEPKRYTPLGLYRGPLVLG